MRRGFGAARKVTYKGNRMSFDKVGFHFYFISFIKGFDWKERGRERGGEKRETMRGSGGGGIRGKG